MRKLIFLLPALWISTTIVAQNAPTSISLSANTIPENEAGALIGEFSVVDPDPNEFHTFLLEGLNQDNEYFKVENGKLYTSDTNPPDFELKSPYIVSVRASSSIDLLYLIRNFAISVTDVNDAPDGITLDKSFVKEGYQESFTISVSDEDADDSHEISFATGSGDTDNDLFTLAGLELTPIAPLDYETKSTYSIRLMATDESAASGEAIVEIDVYDAVNQYAFGKNELIPDKAPASAFNGSDILDDNQGNIWLTGVDLNTYLNDSLIDENVALLRINEAADSIVIDTVEYSFYSYYLSYKLALDANGEVQTLISRNAVIQPGLLYDTAGNRFEIIPDATNNSFVIHKTGSESYTFNGTDYDAFQRIRDFELDTEGNLYIAHAPSYDLAFLTKIDPNGKVVWEMEYPKVNLVTDQSGYYETGYIGIQNIKLQGDQIECEGLFRTQAVNIDGTVITNDTPEGGVLDTFYFTIDTAGSVHNEVGKTGKVLDIKVGDNYYSLGAADGKATIIKYDANKSLVSETATFVPGEAEFYKLGADSASIIMFGTTTRQNIISSTEAGWVARIDLLGNTIYEKLLDETIYDKQNITRLWADGESKAIIHGWTETPFTWDDQSVAEGYFVGTVDAQGTFDSFIQTDSALLDYSVFLPVSDGYYLANADSLIFLNLTFERQWSVALDYSATWGKIAENEEILLAASGGSSGELTKYDKSGNLIWQTTVSNSSGELRFEAIEHIADTSYLVQAQAFSNGPDLLRITRYDESGTETDELLFDYNTTGIEDFQTVNDQLWLATRDSLMVFNSDLTLDTVVFQTDYSMYLADISPEGDIYLNNEKKYAPDWSFSPEKNYTETPEYVGFINNQRIHTNDFYYELLASNEQPESLSIALDQTAVIENSENLFVGKLTTEDDQTSGFTYRLGDLEATYGVPSNFDAETVFLVNANEKFMIKDDSLFVSDSLNYEIQQTEEVILTVFDSLMGHYTATIQLNVGDANDPITDITLAMDNLQEKSSASTGFDVTDEDTTDTYLIELISGVGDNLNEFLSIENNQLHVQSSLDVEEDTITTRDYYTSSAGYGFMDSLRIRITDAGGLYLEKVLELFVADSNELATTIAMDFDGGNRRENGQIYGWFVTDDPEDQNLLRNPNYSPSSITTYDYSLVAGDGDDDNDLFSLSNNTYVSTSGSGVSFDYETDSVYSIRVRLDDPNSDYFLEQAIEIILENQNTAPTGIGLYQDRDATVSIYSLYQYLPADSLLGIVSASPFDREDPNDEFTYSLDANNPYFYLSSDSLFTRQPITLTDSSGTISIPVHVTDQYGEEFEGLELSINNVNNRPTDINIGTRLIYENTLAEISLYTSDNYPTNDSHTYDLVTGDGDENNELFTINENQLLLIDPLDYEAITGVSVRVQTTDSYGETFSKRLDFEVQDGDDLPERIELSNNSVMENQLAGTVVGELNAIDEDTNPSFLYNTFVITGTIDNFYILQENELFYLVTNKPLDHEVIDSLQITLSVYNNNSSITYDSLLTIYVEDQSDSLQISSPSVDESLETGGTIGTLSSVEGSTFSTEFELDYSKVTIDGTSLILAEELNYEENDSIALQIRETLTNGLELIHPLFIQVNDINEAPTDLSLDGMEIAENLAIGTLIGTLTTTDEDAADEWTYSVDNESFTVSANELLTAAEINYELTERFELEITTTDKGGLTYSEVFTITVLNDPTDDAEEVILGAKANNLLIYPNPVKDQVHINSDAFDRYILSDNNGKIIKKGLVKNKNIDVKSLPQGSYFIFLEGKMKSERIRIIKVN